MKKTINNNPITLQHIQDFNSWLNDDQELPGLMETLEYIRDHFTPDQVYDMIDLVDYLRDNEYYVVQW